MRRPIGEYLVQLGVLTEAEVKRVLAHAKCASIRLDEAAIQLKLISPQQLKMVFGPNYRVDFCNLDSLKLPDPTRSMLGINVLIKLGVLPLGFVADIEEEDGKDVFEIGLINPSREDAVAVMRAVACIRFGKEKFEKIKVYLITPEQFLESVYDNYGITEDHLKQRHPNELDASLNGFIRSQVGCA